MIRTADHATCGHRDSFQESRHSLYRSQSLFLLLLLTQGQIFRNAERKYVFRSIMKCGIMLDFFASVALQTTSSLFWDVTHSRFVVSYRRFGAAYQSHLQASSSPRRILDFAQRRLIPTFRDNLSVQTSRVN